MRRWALASAALACLAVRAPRADTIELRNGGRIEGRIERTEPGPPCRRCEGKGARVCPVCAGTGRSASRADCVPCSGSGKVKCASCSGRGTGERRYVITLRGGVRTTIAESEIKSVTKGDIPPEELLPVRESYEARATKLRDPPAGGERDALAELDLARWALSHGLAREALRHSRAVASREPGLRDRVNELVRDAEARLDSAAEAALASAFDHVRARRLGDGLRELKDAIERHADAPVVADPARERRYLDEHARDVADRYGTTLAEIVRSVTRRIELACADCRGSAAAACPACKGTGAGVCARCRGSGKLWCLECNGAEWRVCVRCGGAGKPGGSRFGATGACPDCRSRGIVRCGKCKKGLMACPDCAGKGSRAGACEPCAGRGAKPCAACLGTGLARVTRVRWGPAKELGLEPIVMPAPQEPASSAADGGGGEGGEAPGDGAVTRKAARRIPVWQGLRRGCIVTALRARDLHGGALTEQLSAVLGARRELLALCIDNRDGRDEVAFPPGPPGRAGLRAVTEDARQIECLPAPGAAEIEKLAAAAPGSRDALAELGERGALPGAVASAIAMFPPRTDFAKVASVYWGRDDPLELARLYVTEDELEEIRKTLR